jgi:ribose transport system permease protein
VLETGVATAGDDSESLGRRILGYGERFGLVGLLVIVIVVFSLLRPSTFGSLANFQSIAASQSVLAVAALAFMPALLCGRFDVSVGGMLAASHIFTGAMITAVGLPDPIAIVLGIAFGGLIGLFNGYIVAYRGVDSIIGTLAVSIILGGLVIAYTQGQAMYEGIDPVYSQLGAVRFYGFPVLFLIMIGLAIVTLLVFTQTPFGRRVSAVGSNINAARLSGIPVQRTMLLSFMAGGLLAGCAGVMMIARLGSSNPNVGSLNDILPALAAVFLGATTWRPGQYTVIGTLIALFFVGICISGLALLGTQPWVTSVFNGSVVIVAIAISAILRARRTGAATIGE